MNSRTVDQESKQGVGGADIRIGSSDGVPQRFLPGGGDTIVQLQRRSRTGEISETAQSLTDPRDQAYHDEVG